MFCPSCGREVTEGTAFCVTCGADLKEQPSATPSSPEPDDTSVAPTPAAPATITPPSARAIPWLVIGILATGLALASGGLFLLLKGGSDPIPTGVSPQGQRADLGAAPAGDTSTDVVGDEPSAVAGTQSCSNADLGYSLAFPADWHTLSHRPQQDCRFFSDRPLDFGPGTRFPQSPIGIVRIRATYDEWSGVYNEPSLGLVSQEDTTVGGREAVVVEFAPVDAPEDGGYVYIINLDERPLIMGVVVEHVTDYEVAKGVLDAMVQSMVFE
jgi:hypothetical protein